MITRRRAIELAALAALAGGSGGRAGAQPVAAWPNRFVRMTYRYRFPATPGIDA